MQSATTTLDLRELGCHERHGLVFQCFAVLAAGQAIAILNDHDPEPLRRQLLARFGDQVEWIGEQRGPAEFHAIICRLNATTR